MKKTILFFLIFFSINLQAQRIRTFVGLGTYIHSDFNTSLFVSANTGVEFKVVNYFRPELEIGVMYGTPETLTNYTETGLVESVYERTTSAINYSFSPKIYFGDPKVSDMGVFIRPRYTYSRVFGNTELTERNPNDLSKPIIDKKSASTWDQSLDIGIGISFNFSEKYYHSADIILYYNNINLGDALNTIDDGRTVNTNNTLGLGLLVYFGGKIKY
jgi:hypothetical protein